MTTAAPAAEVQSAVPAPRALRIESVDILRGIVMVVMALDHVRDYFSGVPFDPLDLAETTPALFFTRWVTHFCAPVFVFFAGTGAFLSKSGGKSTGEISRFLLTRGLVLVLLELTVIRVAWQFNINFRIFHGSVIWTIGWSMVALSALVHLPNRVILLFGVLMVVLHNLLDGVSSGTFGPLWWFWNILHVPEKIVLGERSLFNPHYPLIPWIGVMACGYVFGALFRLEERRRRRVLLLLGVGLTALFVVLRAVNVYGDPVAWSVQPESLFTLLSFLNTEKYPASLLFLLMTLGPAIAVLPFLEGPPGRIRRFFVVFGRVPLFYYILHLYLIHALALVAGVLQGFPAERFLLGHWVFPKKYGFDLPVVYGVWIAVVGMLYPVCAWYAGLKRRSRSRWLSYL